MKKLILILLLTQYFQIFSQNISNKSIEGVWKVTEIQIDSNVFDDSNIDNFNSVKLFFNDVKFLFSKKGLFKAESKKIIPDPFNNKFVNTVFYYEIDNNILSIGNLKKSSNILYIQIKEDNNALYFNFNGALLKVKKIENTCKLQISKESLKSQKPFLTKKPLTYFDISEDEITLEGIDQPIQTYNCSYINGNILLKQCVSRTISWFFNRKFNPDIASEIGLSGRLKNEISFIIDKEGSIVNIEVKSINSQLSDEISRTINMLPKFIPAKKNNKAINTKYSFPFIFQIQD